MRSLTLRAHAKVNLFLKVGRKRKDGYHSLQTMFQEISLHDRLRFKLNPGPHLRLSISGRKLSAGKNNLVVRALCLLRDRLGAKKGMNVHLVKKIPMAAGLGGGSSDAASALWGGWLLWKRASPSNFRRKIPPLLYACARELGADVPFFLKGGRAIGTGIGDKLKFLPASGRRWMILVYPRVHVPTPLAYRFLDQSKRVDDTRRQVKYFNSFEPVVFNRFPRVARVAKAMTELGCRPVLMSGSGSSVFGMVRSKKEGRFIKRSLSKVGWDVFLVHTKGR